MFLALLVLLQQEGGQLQAQKEEIINLTQKRRNRDVVIFVFGGVFFYLRLGLVCLRLVFVTYGCLFCLRLKFGLVFFAYGGNLVWSFVLTVENRLGLFYLRFPSSRKLGLVFFCLRFPYRKQKRRTVSKKTSTVSKKDASFVFRDSKVKKVWLFELQTSLLSHCGGQKLLFVHLWVFSQRKGPFPKNASPEEKSEAPRQRWKPGREHHPGPGNQGQSAHAESTQGAFHWITRFETPGKRFLLKKE